MASDLEVEIADLEPADVGPVPSELRAQGRFARLLTSGALSPASTVPTFIGLAVVVAGFALIGYAWGRVAALTSVALQLPYLVSAGCTGLGLVVVGVTVIAVHARRQDAAARARQVELLADLVAELRVKS